MKKKDTVTPIEIALAGQYDHYVKEYGKLRQAYLSDDKDGAPIKIGTKVIKRNSERRDKVVDGSKGQVIGSISEPIEPPRMKPDYCYSVIWDDYKDSVFFIVGKKLKICD